MGLVEDEDFIAIAGRGESGTFTQFTGIVHTVMGGAPNKARRFHMREVCMSGEDTEQQQEQAAKRYEIVCGLTLAVLAAVIYYLYHRFFPELDLQTLLNEFANFLGQWTYLTVVAPARITASSSRHRKSGSLRPASSGENSTSSV